MTPDERRDVAQGITEALVELARAHRILDGEGHNDMSLGHLSLRDPAGRGFWLKRANIGLEEVLSERDFLLLDFTGTVLEGEGIRHLEWPIHAAILEARPTVGVVAHTHPFHATVLSATEEHIGPYTNEGVWFESGVTHFKLTSDLVNTPELGRELALALGEAEAVLLKNHGATFVGATVKEATLAGVFLERAARAQLALASSGLACSHPDAAEIHQKRQTIYPPRAVDNFWRYYNRKLDRAERRPPAAARGDGTQTREDTTP
jgi:L-fuculose-phosphate aldolase